MRRLSALAVAGLVALTASLAPANHIPAGDPLRLSVSQGGQTVRGTAGSYCIRRHLEGDSYSNVCADTVGVPRVKGLLRVRPGTRLLIRTGVRAKSVWVTLARLGRDREHFTELRKRRAHRIGRSLRRWRYRLPEDFRGATRLSVFIRWDHPSEGRGDASFSAGIRAR